MNLAALRIFTIPAFAGALLCWGQVNAAVGNVGGVSLGITCTDEGDKPTCTCKPPITSGDCAKLLKYCERTVIDVEPWEDAWGHPHDQQIVPKADCTATECSCDWVKKTSAEPSTSALDQNQQNAPAKSKSTSPRYYGNMKISPVYKNVK